MNVLVGALAKEPEFVEPIPNVTVAVGRDAVLSCVIEYLGAYKVAWFHIDKQMILTIHHHVITRDHRISVSDNNNRHWMLHIRNVQEHDSGYYMCQINTTPMKSQVGYLEVNVPPDILDQESSPSTVKVREGSNVSLICKASGYPEPTMMWRREDNEPILLSKKQVLTLDGEFLNVSKVSRNHMGAYLCIASNGVPPAISKRIMLDVEFSPIISIPNQLVGALPGSEVMLECSTEAFPKSINYWARGPGMIMTNNKYETVTMESLYRIIMKLKIKSLTHNDYGNYKCIAKNYLGETEGAVELYELQRPTRPPRPPEDWLSLPAAVFTNYTSLKNGTSSRSKNSGSWQNSLIEDPTKKYLHSKDKDGSDDDEAFFGPPKHKSTSDNGANASSCIRRFILLEWICAVLLGLIMPLL
ncbi:hypothetical protein CHUAL_012578 [Chamberlinius hualienensis]